MAKKKKRKEWEKFEKLAYEYVSFLHKNQCVEKQLQTESSHDSGYDGLWVIFSKDQLCYQKILMEAKFRNSQSSLPLNDCAKAIIIAYNSNASKLYIATNIAYAPQTQKEIAQYNKRSDLTVICVKNSELKAFIQEKRDYLISECELEKDFLDKIEYNANSTLESLIDGDFCIDDHEKYLQDSIREKMKQDIFQGLCCPNACSMLMGNEGIGKSILAKQISEKLFEKNFSVNIIDLNLCTSSRILYLKLLESLWGVTLVSILEDKGICSYIDQLIAVNGEVIDVSVSHAIKHILAASYYEYEGYKDNYLYLLLKYLDNILKLKREKNRLVIFFENLNMASEEVLSFLIPLAKHLKINNVRILFEVRTPFLLDNHKYTEKSMFYFEQLKGISNQCFSLEAIDHDVATTFVQRALGLSEYVCGHLADYLGNNFLELQSAIQILECQPFVLNEHIDDMTNTALEEYWNSCGLSANNVVISLIIRLRKISLFSSLFELILLLRGEAPFQVIEDLYGDKSSKYIKEAIESTVFMVKGENLVCKHLRYLNAMQKTSQDYERVNIASRLLPIIQKNRNSIASYAYVELDLLYILSKFDDIPSCTLNVISLLTDDRQYKKAIETAKRYIEFSENTKPKVPTSNTMLLQISLQALQCMRELHAENDEKYKYLFQLAQKYILINNPDTASNKSWYKYQLLLWHKDFVVGEFEKAYRISKKLFSELPQSAVLFDESEDYVGQVYNAHGLSIKMVEGGDSAETFFEEGVKEYSRSYYAKAALLSQEGNRLLKTEPALACKKYMELLESIKGREYPFQEILHTRIDVAMSAFLAGNIDVALEWSKDSADIASSVGIYMQKGRALNILGCCQAVEGQYSKSIKSFSESSRLLSLSKATIYAWRAQLNLASVLLKIGRKEEAFLKLDEVLYVLQTHFKTKIKVDKMSVPYKSILLILMYLYKESNKEKTDNIIKEIGEETVAEDFLQLSKNKNWREYFCGKVKYYNEIVLVTG